VKYTSGIHLLALGRLAIYHGAYLCTFSGIDDAPEGTYRIGDFEFFAPFIRSREEYDRDRDH
jgi:hypothetical protein